MREASGFRIQLRAGAAEARQTGVYSYFALAGDWDVVVTYELLNVPPPRAGYGSGVGLAVDAGDGIGRGSIQRVSTTAQESGYVLQTNLAARGPKAKEKHRFVPGSPKRGRLGLKRVQNELIFLAAAGPSAPLQELDRFPFTDGTIRTVRLFADAGGSATTVDVRVKDIRVRAEEITAGLPRRGPGGASPWWLWAIVPASGLALLYWRRRPRQA